MNPIWLAILGTWLLSDGIYSISLYANAESYGGRKQTWKADHWIRAVRGIIGLVLIGGALWQ